MEKPDIAALAGKMIEAVRTAIARSEAAIGKRIEELDARLKVIPPGERGERGPAGESIKGEKGEAGKDGAPGKDAVVDMAALAEMVRAAVAALPVPKDGAAGKDGAPGAKGETGVSLKGEPGAKGEAGEPGRDAAALEILPSIDESKSYRRGTWASHAGGLIRAERATDPVTDGLSKAGWVVMVEGLAAVVVTQGDDPRELTVAAMLTSGAKVLSEFRMPAMVYQEVWREGAYERGDVVTWGGSAWHCQQKTTDQPGKSAAWKLMVKEGRPGKDSSPPVPQVKELVRLR